MLWKYYKACKKKTLIFDILCNYNVTRIRPSARGIRPFCRTWCQSGIYVDIAAKPHTVRRRSCGCTTAPPRSPTLSSSRRRHANALGSGNSCRGKRAWEFKPNGSKANTQVFQTALSSRELYSNMIQKFAPTFLAWGVSQQFFNPTNSKAPSQ